jgi:membrane associated rhomboid family serine protease
MNPYRRGPASFGMSSGAPPDVVALVAVVFVTFSLQFFSGTVWITELLRLTPRVWQLGFVWQLLTYPVAGAGAPTFWILLELLILFWFGRDVLSRLGRARFWRLLVTSCVAAGVVALLVDLVARFVGQVPEASLAMAQGQRMLLAVLVAAFAVLFRDAQILLFFVLPVQARWFLPLEIVFAFIGFLRTKDLAGFLGICVAVGATWLLLTRGSARGGGRETWLRLQQWMMQRRMARLRRQRGFRVVERDPKDRWLH